MHNLLASAVLLGACSWLQELVLAHKPKTRKFEVLREIVSGAQEALFANIAQQLAPGKKVNSAAFMATFAGLHIAQTGIKHLAQHLMANTKGGKKVAARFQKLPAQKQNAMKHAATATSWFTKTLLAKHLVG